MDKSTIDAMSMDIKKLKELEPDFADSINELCCGTSWHHGVTKLEDFEWLVTRLYLTASLKGFMLGKSEEAKRISEQLGHIKATAEVPTE